MHHFSSQKPVDKTDGLWGSVVAWDRDVDVFQQGVAIAEGNNWDVDVAGLSDGLVVDGWIGNDDQSWFSVARLGVIGKGTWTKSAVDRGGTNKFGELEDGSLTEIFAGDEANVFRVFDGGDDSGGEHDLFPHFVDVEDVSTRGFFSFENVLGHLVVAVSVAEVGF